MKEALKSKLLIAVERNTTLINILDLLHVFAHLTQFLQEVFVAKLSCNKCLHPSVLIFKSLMIYKLHLITGHVSMCPRSSTHPGVKMVHIIINGKQLYLSWQSFYDHLLYKPFSRQGYSVIISLTLWVDLLVDRKLPISFLPEELMEIRDQDIGEQLTKSPVICKQTRTGGGWLGCVSARDNFTENSSPGWRWLIVF